MNHLDDTNKMISETPRMDSVAGHARGIVDAAILAEGIKMERELNAANVEIEEKRKDVVYLATEKAKLENRIKRLEEENDAMRADLLFDTYPQTIVRELNRMADRIKRLEEAGDAAIHKAGHGREHDALEIWNKAKEDKL